LAVQKLNENPIKTVVELILKNRSYADDVRKDDIIFEIIKWQRLDRKNAEPVFQAMLKLGLDSCTNSPSLDPNDSRFDGVIQYNVCKFAVMRNYFTEKQVKQFQDRAKRPRNRR